MPRIWSFLLTVQRAWKIKIPCEKRTEKNALSKKQTHIFEEEAGRFSEKNKTPHFEESALSY